MPDGPPPATGAGELSEYGPPPALRRAILLGLFAIVVGLTIWTVVAVNAAMSVPTPHAQQAASTLELELVSDDGVPLDDVEVAVRLVPRDPSRAASSASTVRGDGRIAVELPALDGHYVIEVGAPGRIARELVHSPALGVGIEGPIVLEAGAKLEIGGVTADVGTSVMIGTSNAGGTRVDRSSSPGSYELCRQQQGVFGLDDSDDIREGTFESIPFVLDGLAPGYWRVRVSLDVGSLSSGIYLFRAGETTAVNVYVPTPIR